MVLLVPCLYCTCKPKQTPLLLHKPPYHQQHTVCHLGYLGYWQTCRLRRLTSRIIPSPECWASKMLLYETIAVSLFACLLMPVVLVACGFTYHSRTLKTHHVRLCCVPLCIPPHGFSSKRDYSRQCRLFLQWDIEHLHQKCKEQIRRIDNKS